MLKKYSIIMGLVAVIIILIIIITHLAETRVNSNFNQANTSGTPNMPNQSQLQQTGKPLLQKSPPQQQTQSSQSQPSQLPISQSFLPQSVVKLICSENVYQAIKQGSGVLYHVVANGNFYNGFSPFYIETNLHVVNTDDGSPSRCLITVYPDIKDSNNFLLYQSFGYDYIGGNMDIALIKPELIPDKPNAGTLDGLYKYAQDELKSPYCENVALGDKLRVLGYPAIGEETLTETDGIVSGFETDQGIYYIKTDAKIDHGNSGGIAIAESGCLLGIPTFVVNFGGFESLGRIIDFSKDLPKGINLFFQK